MNEDTKGRIYDIVYHPNPILRKKAAPIKVERIKQKKFQQFISDLEDTMVAKDGAGLAAPQVGNSERIIAIAGPAGENIIMINPEITKKSWAKVVGEEGCLSVVDDKGRIIFGQVERHKHISCSYIDSKGKKKKIQPDERLSRVIQHEVDHLDGILFIDRLVK